MVLCLFDRDAEELSGDVYRRSSLQGLLRWTSQGTGAICPRCHHGSEELKIHLAAESNYSAFRQTEVSRSSRRITVENSENLLGISLETP